MFNRSDNPLGLGDGLHIIFTPDEKQVLPTEITSVTVKNVEEARWAVQNVNNAVMYCLRHDGRYATAYNLKDAIDFFESTPETYTREEVDGLIQFVKQRIRTGLFTSKAAYDSTVERIDADYKNWQKS